MTNMWTSKTENAKVERVFKTSSPTGTISITNAKTPDGKFRTEMCFELLQATLLEEREVQIL